MSRETPDLYGVARPKRKPRQEISSSTSSDFSTKLRALLSQDTRDSKRVNPGRSRTKTDLKPKKADIFTAHRVKKRALIEPDQDESGSRHQTQDVIGGVEEAILKRSKRRLEEKAKRYAAMKRGDYVEPERSNAYKDEDAPLVDFDRKWAEEGGNDESDSNSSTEGIVMDRNELIEYTDEYGRLRKGTKGQIAREERQQRVQRKAMEELDDLSARPKMPSKLIYGDAVQAAAFNPDAAIERQMEELAARRDRSMTPPEEAHYDASKEIRSKGVGFYQFSRNESQRREEMSELEDSRKRTEQWDKERVSEMDDKDHNENERSRYDQERLAERQANAFLKSLGNDLGTFVTAEANEDVDTRKKKKGWGK